MNQILSSIAQTVCPTATAGSFGKARRMPSAARSFFQRRRRPATALTSVLGGAALSALALGSLVGGALAPAAHGQELMRDSLAGADVAEARRPSMEEQNYNLRVGPVRFLASAYAGAEYSDNIGYSENNRISDVLIRFGVNLEAIWNITRLNTLDVNIGIGYLRYVDHPNATNTNILIAPGSQVAFDIYIANTYRINIHDRFDLRQDPIDNPTLSNVTDFARFTNTAGLTLIADYNGVVVTAGYDHFNYLSLNSTFDYLDRSAEQFFGSVVFNIAPRTFLGVEGTAAITNYDRNFNNDSVGGTVGLFLDWTMNPNLRLIARGGYQVANFDTGGQFGDTSDLNSFYANLTIENRLNAYLTQTLSGGRENDLGLTSNYIEVNYVRWNAAWRILRDVSFGTGAFYEHDKESGGPVNETLDRYGFDISLGYSFNQHISALLHYAYVNKDSNQEFRSYYQNRAGIDVNYRF